MPAAAAKGGYQRRDQRVVDYREYELPGTGLRFRGPAPALRSGAYFACLGGAQTFGCLCERPYPALLEASLGLESLNLGRAGAGPVFFLRHPRLLEYVNRARFAIVQVMSGRSVDDRAFRSEGRELLLRRADGARLGADAAYDALLAESSLASLSLGGRRMHLFLRRPRRVRDLVDETRARWTADSQALLRAIRVPTVLLYLSRRAPDYRCGYATVRRLFGDAPELVDRRMIDAVRPLADRYVECVTHRGSPQPLRDRETGEPVTIDLSLDRADLVGEWSANPYYPSPEMHEDAARALASACRHALRSPVCGR